MPSKLLTLVTGPELICFLVAVICLLKDKSKVWRSMILYLFITCLAEVGGLYIRRVLHQPNGWVYDIYTIFELGFPSLMFLHLLGKYRDSKPLILTGLTVTMIVYIAPNFRDMRCLGIMPLHLQCYRFVMWFIAFTTITWLLKMRPILTLNTQQRFGG
jgi:hypothetical protein